jgi:hypothetical protein
MALFSADPVQPIEGTIPASSNREQLHGQKLAAPAKLASAAIHAQLVSPLRPHARCTRSPAPQATVSDLAPLRSFKATCSSRMKRATIAYTIVREQKRTRAISVGERPLAQSNTMCILSLLLDRLSRFNSWMRSLRSSETRVILCIRSAVSLMDGFGVFTMPQEITICSVILCIYLGEPRYRRS